MTVDPPAGRDPAAPRRRLQRQVLSDDVHESIKAMIMDHGIAPGSRISIDGLARELGVSPTPVREALARLESEALVVKEPLRGYSTRPLMTLDQLEDLFDFRLVVEPWGAARAAARASAADVERIDRELASCAGIPEGASYAAYRAVAEHDLRFHALVLRVGGNESARTAFGHTNCHLHIFRLAYGWSYAAAALEEHRRLRDAIAGGVPEAAAAAMHDHLVRSRARLRAGFD